MTGSELKYIPLYFNRKYKDQERSKGKYLKFCELVILFYFFFWAVDQCHGEFEFISDPTFVYRNELSGELLS